MLVTMLCQKPLKIATSFRKSVKSGIFTLRMLEYGYPGIKRCLQINSIAYSERVDNGNAFVNRSLSSVSLFYLRFVALSRIFRCISAEGK